MSYKEGLRTTHTLTQCTACTSGTPNISELMQVVMQLTTTLTPPPAPAFSPAQQPAWFNLTPFLFVAWRRAQTGAEAGPAPQFVETHTSPLSGSPPSYDVVVAGGTLGVFVATALAQRGWRVAVVERGPLRGRSQV